jgi:1,4-dihydroxy-2-naphthoate octaprenyltransferase
MSPRFGSPWRKTKTEGSPAEPVVASAEPVAAPAEPAEPIVESFGAPASALGVQSSLATATPEPSAGSAAETDVRSDSLSRGLTELAEYPEALLSWVAEDGYPLSVAIPIDVVPDEGLLRFTEPSGFKIPSGAIVGLTGSSINVLPDGGFDERRHVTVWGSATARPRGRFLLKPSRAWSWSQNDPPLPAAYERRLPKARRYYSALSAERGTRVRPRVSVDTLFLRATRASLLGATLVPVLVGLAVAARAGFFDMVAALLTVCAAVLVHLGFNVANDVFDKLLGADDANATPTRFSGGSRVLQSALITLREMSVLSLGLLALAAVLGLVLIGLHGSVTLVAIAVAGVVIGLAYTMPPLKLAYRGLGEVAAAIGFGPLMLLGAYTIQTGGTLAVDAVLVSLPIGALAATILIVNGIPDRAADSTAGKKTLAVRLSRKAILRVVDLAMLFAFTATVVGVGAGVLPVFGLLVLVAAVPAARVATALANASDEPYGLVGPMAANIGLHLAFGALVLCAYALAIADQAALGLRPFLW